MYAISNKNEKNGEIKQCDTGFTFVDFFPKKIPPSGRFGSTTYESFRVVVDRANEFLRCNTKWNIVTCETVAFRLSSKKVDPVSVTFKKNKQSATSYIRGLRLWLTEREDEKETEQQIGYFNLIPRKMEQEKSSSFSKRETLNDAIQRFNLMQKSNPLPGRIITMETTEMHFTSLEKIDPDLSNWSEPSMYIRFLSFVVRIFYVVMDCTHEEIGIQDFTPVKLSGGGFLSEPEYERFSNVMNRASSWLAHQSDIRFCNAQTIEMSGDGGVDTQRMASTHKREYCVRMLRMAYTKPAANSYSIGKNPQLTCKDFVPKQLSTGMFSFKYENFVDTKGRISAWIKATGARVLSVETTTYRVKTGGEKIAGTDSSFTYDYEDTFTSSEDWIFIIRLYLDGFFKEPPAEMLPGEPGIAQSSCNIS